jgi:aminopeptidase 2
MLLLRVGEGAFLRGVTSLLRARRHGSATSADLWRAIAEAAGEEVGPMMRAWTAAPGCPCLVVTETRTGIRVRQARFVDTGAAAEDDGVLWSAPPVSSEPDSGAR